MKPEGKSIKEQQKDTMSNTDNNVMPSMVVRQQRIHMNNSAIQAGLLAGGPHLSSFGDGTRCKSADAHLNATTNIPQPPPPPTSSLIKAAKEMVNSSVQQQQQLFDQNGLVLPKRVLHHPMPAAQPIIRDLNREIKFNQTRGKNVLDQKSELKKALEKLEENKRKKKAEQERLSRRTSLELRLEERAEKIAKEATNSQQVPMRRDPQDSTQDTVPAAAACNPLSNFSIRPITR